MPAAARHERRERERFEQDQREAPLRRRGRDQRVHRRDAHDRLVLVDRPDRLSNGGRERAGVAARADDKRHHPVREAPLAAADDLALALRDVHRIRFAQRQRQLLHVAHHADDGVGRSVGRTDAQALADRVGSRKPPLRQRFADERDERSARAIVARRAARPRRSGNAHRLDVARADGVAEHAVRLGRLRRSGLEVHAVLVQVAAQRQLAGERGAVTPGTRRTASSACSKNRYVVAGRRRIDVRTSAPAS